MRRFITSLAGKVLSHLVVLSLLVSVFAATIASRAVAQVQMLPLWAVTEFQVHNGLDQSYGQIAAGDLQSELSSSGKYQLLSGTQVQSKIKSLGLTSPLDGTVNVLRVGQDLKAYAIVTGDVIAAKIEHVGGGQQAKVAIRAVAYNVASGLPINGAAVEGDSVVKSGDVSEKELISDAIRAASNTAMRQFNQHQLPTATVLNTLTDSCYFNAGSRAGFSNGQEVVITRGREEVATGHVADLQPDEAVVVIERPLLGVAPGDKVSAIYPIPDVSFDAPFAAKGDQQLRVTRKPNIGNNAGLISLLVVAGLVGVLLGNGGNTNTVLTNVTAQAALYPPQTFGPTPAVYVNWTANGYAKGNSQVAAWQVWRSDVTNAPVAVTQGPVENVYDLQYASGVDTQYTTWTFMNGVIGGTTCNEFGSFNNEAAPTTLPSLIPGTSYTYQVELVYALSEIDLPITSTSGSTASGTTSTSTTSTSTTSGTTTSTTSGTTTSTTSGTTTSSTSGTTGTTSTGTTSTGSTSGTLCYFITQRQSSGLATPLNQPALVAPAAGTPIAPNAAASGTGSVGTTFQFQGSARQNPLAIQYLIQFSLQSTFPNNSSQTFNYPSTITSFGSGGSSGSTVSTKPLIVFGTNSILPSQFQSAATVFWRVGARATADSPGPQPDPFTHLRYIFSTPGYFTQQGQPPNGPSAKAKTNSKAKTPTNSGHRVH